MSDELSNRTGEFDIDAIERIVVAMDASPQSVAALRAAAQLAS